VFKNLENEYKIGQRKGDCEKYYWLAGADNFYSNRTNDRVTAGTINRRIFAPGGISVLGPPTGLGDFPFEFDNTIDFSEIYDDELWTNETFSPLPAPLDSVVIQTENKFFSSGPGSQNAILKFEVLLTTRMSHVQAFKCGVEIFSARYFKPDDNAAFISFEAASEKLCDKCANPFDTDLDNRIILDEPNITFRDKPHEVFDLSITRDENVEDFGELDLHEDNIGIEEIRKFYFITEPVTQATIDAADPGNQSPILWDDPQSIQPGLLLAPPPGSSFTAFGFLYTLDYKISGTDRVVGRLNDPPTQQSSLVGLNIKQWTPDDFFRFEVYENFVYDEDRADRLWSTDAGV